ncbi:MAG TPA: serine/threonine-protein kinase [Gemmatimonadales bacterium]|nr:serine/threonine-protein kinase [Gemmatimonadales bacterium]
MPDTLERLDAVLRGRYTLDREVGRGGMATVYLAHDLRHGREVALKVLRPELAAAVGPERFLREIRILAHLQHPHILPLYDSGTFELPAGPGGGATVLLPWYVMPYVEGESLRERLAREGPLPVAEAVQIAREVAGALAYAHARDVVHRDITPGNILLAEGEAIVADFGVARALTAAAGGNSEGGLVVGTPAYMSPEQASGAAVDGRGDVYSLGCVVYEMLTGEPPFTGRTVQVILARQQSEAPRALRSVRPQIPPALEGVVLTALAKLPADRFRTAADFARALAVAAPASASGEIVLTPVAAPPAPPAPPARPAAPGAVRAARRWLRGHLPWVFALAGIAALASVPAVRSWRASPPLDAGLYLVAPFEHRAGAAPGLLTGDQCESLAWEALARWSGLRIVDPLWVSDGRARRGLARLGLADALALARERGAGRLVTGEVYTYRDTVRVRAALYDVRRPATPLRSARVAVAPDLHDTEARFDELARRLVVGTTSLGGTVAPVGAGATRSLAAWRRFDEGMRAFRAWDLPRARAALADAAREDAAYAEPRLWLAQLLVLEGDTAAAWRDYARDAARLADHLPATDRRRATALASLADARYPQACAVYDSLTRADSLDFFAWYGLGECQARDQLVVRDPQSPSGWRFRASLHRALEAYGRALEVTPSSHLLFRGAALDGLARLFLVDPSVYRPGYRLDPDTVRFAAWPGLGTGDTLALVPWPAAAVFDGKPGTRPASTHRALARNRERLLAVTTEWLRTFPRSAPALEMHARALELAGRLDGATPEESALLAATTAQRVAGLAVPRARLAAMRVRILVKLERFPVARWLADSALAANPAPGDSVAEQLVGLAALTGRERRALALVRPLGARYEGASDDATIVRPPPALGTAALELLVWASFAAPAESARAAYARADRLVTSWYAPAERERVRQAVLSRAEAVGFFDAGLVARARPTALAHRLRRAEWGLAHGDTAAVRRDLAAMHRTNDGRAGDIGMPGLYALSRLHLALADTAGALALLDPVLGALPTLDAYLLLEVPDPVALVRAMALRADLAAAQRDRETAAKWSAAVAALWSGADPALRPVVSRMQALAR